MSTSSTGRDSSELGGPALRAKTEGTALYLSWGGESKKQASQRSKG